MKQAITTVLDLCGIALLVAGIALIYIPAAFLAAGMGLLAISWRASK
ncbi:hypothetical protein [Arthrobacter sp. B1805]|nr:hypothetical protein [Arthrobacter sp. B1805]